MGNDNSGTQIASIKSDSKKIWDVAIVGSGPAALTAAIYTTRGAASTLIIGGYKWGGQLMLTTNVDNFPGFPEGIQGPELMLKMRTQAEKFGAEFVQKDIESVDFGKNPFELKAGLENFYAKSVILSSGADIKWLGVAGESKLIGRGVSSCAPCDAPLFKGKKVAVVGGGDSAMEETIVLAKYAHSVVVIHRRNEFRASAAMQQKVLNMQKEGKVKILWDTEVIEDLGEVKLEKIKLKTKLDSEQSKMLRTDAVKDLQLTIGEEKEGYLYWEMPLDGLFVAIGHTPSTKVYQDKIELDEKGYIKRFEKNGFYTSTSVLGVFVAGDVHDFNYKQAITAAGFGCMAGMDTLKYLEKEVPTW